jgi:hypothetical protein
MMEHRRMYVYDHPRECGDGCALPLVWHELSGRWLHLADRSPCKRKGQNDDRPVVQG